MATELVNSATSNKLTEMDWTKNIEICELVARDHRQAKDVMKAIKKRLGSKNPNTQIFAVNLLEMLINNIGESVHKQVIDTGILPLLVKLVKKNSENPVREKVFLLLDAAQTSLGGASGRFPEYHAAYYELVSAGLQFPERPPEIPKPQTSSNVNKNSPPVKETVSPQYDRNVAQTQDQTVPESSIIQKAYTALEVLRDVLDTVDTQHPEAAKDEFTLDLVEQCSFQKQRVMHLAITSRDESTVSKAIELNEQLEKVLRRHDDLVAGRSMSVSNHINCEHEEEEDEGEEQLFRRIRKGKSCVRPEDEDHHINRPLGLSGRPLSSEMINRPLIRPLTTHQQEPIQPQVGSTQEIVQPIVVEVKHEANSGKNTVAIPPPPSKHVERKKFFQENKSDGSALNGHMRNLSLHSRNANCSRSGSMDLSDRDN